jgi:hypothetical protein
MISSNLWFTKTHVVAIGIDDYTNGIPPLEKAVNDAIEIANIVKELKPTEKVEYYFSLAFKPKYISDVEQKLAWFSSHTYPSTKQGFCDLLSHLKKTVKKNERIILYFAGHGIARPFVRLSKESSSSTGSQFQVTLDTKPQGFLLLQDAKKGEPDTYVKMDEVIESLKDIECRHGLIILDCCFAGAVEWSLYRAITRQVGDEDITPSILDRYITKNAWQILTSSSENEKTNEYFSLEEQLEKSDRGSDQNSPFVISLRKALIDGDHEYPQLKEKEFIHTTRLFDYLRGQVIKRSNEDNKLQTPCLFPFPVKHDQTAEFVFLLNGKNLDEIKDKLPKDPDIRTIKNPYLGLESYSPEDYDIFFGRERLIRQLLDCVKKNEQTGFSLTVVLGASGSGKSSLVKAGLIGKIFAKEIEEFKRQQVTVIPQYQIVRPGRFPGDTLEKAVKNLAISNSANGTKCLMVIDQFEEVETQCEDPKQKDIFWRELFQLLEKNRTKVDVVLTLRSDFETTLRSQFESAFVKLLNVEEGKASDSWVSARFPVPLMEREELEKVITKPAEKSVVFFEDKTNGDERTLVGQLIHEVTGMPGALPLLSVALNSMYENFKKRYLDSTLKAKREITWEDYRQLGKGGITGAIRRKATELSNALSGKEKRVLRWVMMRMITRKGNQPPVRKQVMQTELQYSEECNEYNAYRKTVIDCFMENRLFVSGDDGTDAYYEPAHDALVREWDELQVWIEEEKNLDLRQSLALASREWKSRDCDPDSLWNQDIERLKQLETIVDSGDCWLNELELSFFRASVAERDRQDQEKLNTTLEMSITQSQGLFKDNKFEALTVLIERGKDSKHELEKYEFSKLYFLISFRDMFGELEACRSISEQDTVTSVSFTSHKNILASSDRKTIKLWNADGTIKQISDRSEFGV